MNTHQEKLALIRTKCIEANPDIMELKFGCRFKLDGRIWTFLFEDQLYRFHALSVDGTRWDGMEIAREIIQQIPSPFIGRQITLSDVLLAMRAKNSSYAIQCSGHFMWFGTSDEVGEAIDWNEVWSDGQRRAWNLHKTLEDQAPETINFIYDILK